MTALRPYQERVLDDVAAQIAAGHRRVLIVAPTGAGKTVIAAESIRGTVEQRHRVLFIAHRRELISQAARRLYDAGIDAGIIQAGYPTRPGEPVQIASVQTLHARAIRGTAMELPPADIIVVDEAHHVRARTYKSILTAYPNATVLGLTATPCRGDGRGLGNAFEVIVECPGVAELTAAGFLVPARIYAPTKPDLEGLRIARGDYSEGELAERIDKPQLVGDVVTHWHRLGQSRRTVVFACGVAHSLHLRDEFRRSGVMAEHVDGNTPPEERDRIFAGLVDGTVDLVTNVGVATEGWDCPQASCLVLARPTKSLGLYRQMVGRVLRPAPGKVDALILDHAGAVHEHGLPDDPIVWTLAADRRAENKAQAARQSYRAPRLATCPECSAIRMEGKPCPSCGWFPKGRAEPIEVLDGDLAPVDRMGHSQAHLADRAERRHFHGQLEWIARTRGYKSGWVGHKYREKYGDWPPDRHVAPVEPDAAMQAWIRSRQIAYAKAMGKQRGAA